MILVVGFAGRSAVLILFLVIYLGWGQRVLDRMRLSRWIALLLLAIMLAGSFLPEIGLGSFLSVDVGGALVPLGVALYLVITADRRVEKVRAMGAALAVGLATFLLDKLLPLEMWFAVLDPDPLLTPVGLAAVLAYALGRSRRVAFVAGTVGIILSDLAAVGENLVQGLPAVVAVGGAGVFDAAVVAGFGAVLLVELVGETREYLARRGRAIQVAARVGLIALLVLGLWRWGGVPWDGLGEVRSGEPFRLLSEDQAVLTVTSRILRRGDLFIDGDDVVHRVVRVRGRTAWSQVSGEDPGALGAAIRAQTLLERILGGDEPDEGLDVAIYFTHNAESYVPSDGTDSIYGRGGIHQVGQTLAGELADLGVEVELSENLHLPHDRGAYRRSRRTATELIGLGPEILLDLHRDAAPPEAYAQKVEGEWMVQVQPVIGTYNPGFQANRQFAQELKTLADRLYPGLFRGILVTQGNYNQDLGPRAILVEVGAHTNTRESAERAMTPFADVLARYLEGER